MEDIIISVIMPVYNGEKFIKRSVESVLCQMNGAIELILVNDGSTDNSGFICDEYARNNDKIIVIHKQNGGTSSAKNMGIDIARGLYLTFIDCDDFIDSDAYSNIILKLLKYQPDCLDFGWRYVRDGEQMPQAIHRLPKNQLLNEAVLQELILPPLLNLRQDSDNFIFDFAVNKLYKTELIKKQKIRFDEDKKTWEDRTFLLRYLKYCNNYYSMDKCFYNYVYVPNSLSQRYCLDYFRIILENFNHYRELFGDKYDFDTQYVNNYWAKAIENMIYHSLAQTENIEIIRTNILDTLKNEQVVHWFSKRNPSTMAEQIAGEYIINGDPEKALDIYKKESKKIKSKQKMCEFKRKLKRVLKFW